MLQVSEEFIQTIVEVHGERGWVWISQLPAILDSCAQQWRVTLGPPFPNLSYNYVAPAIRADGAAVVIKACPSSEMESEFQAQVAALDWYGGHGAVQLLAVDAAQAVMLLERLEPGTLLSTVEDDAEATSIAAGVMRNLWRTGAAGQDLPTVADWGEGFVRLRARYGGGSGPLRPQLLDAAERLYAELSAAAAAPVVLHGDLHQYNIMRGERRGWLAIDPKGLIGEPAYEIGAFLRNCLPEPLPNDAAARLTERRVQQFAAELTIDRARVRGWGLAQAVLSAWWSLEDHGHGWEPMAALAEILLAMKE